MVNCSGYLYSDHALKAMVTRFIRSYEVEDVIKNGAVIKNYPTDNPYPSYLLLKFVNKRPLHVVVAQNPDTMECIIITCYEPDPSIWKPDFKEKNEFL